MSKHSILWLNKCRKVLTYFVFRPLKETYLIHTHKIHESWNFTLTSSQETDYNILSSIPTSYLSTIKSLIFTDRYSAILFSKSKEGCLRLLQYALIVLKLLPSSFANCVWEISFSTSTSFILFSFIFQAFDLQLSNAKITIIFHQTTSFTLYL